MPHQHRFFVHTAGGLVPPGSLTLSPDEAHHALRVVRAREGDRVLLFDGLGREYVASVRRCSKRDVEVAVESVREEPRPSPVITLAVASLHQDKALEFVVKHGTELGVSRFVFFRAARSERPPRLNPKWKRLVVEACKQCDRLWLPSFEVCESTEAMLERAGAQILVAALDTVPMPLSSIQLKDKITLAVGPEGDFTDEELALLRNKGAKPISLGEKTFRTEVAAIVATTLVQFQAGQLGPV